ncbi:hypothetical protein PFICI_01700 [Pestalotiopsis fici W106-1]|uniref:Uncharacterized protein n=1 Tax=Pestalotiopsis fici (strain W106-1 / CGMCC3.15140) TaxID=1229662 RepID=W3XQT3_PESFW|nr:uncharacterized protein PFICI_01700 [Pestalotiopsis fici W106-1]ETS87872.1 hypothetical protein PFICI_01700 [Pestalotiopsis fici W106-1]
MHFLTSLVLVALNCNIINAHIDPYTGPRDGNRKALNHKHVFNALNSALRKRESTTNQNGMSFFLATVPEGTPLFHGNPKSDRINGTEFLAFDPEFSLIFARKHGGNGHGDRHDGRLLDHDEQQPLVDGEAQIAQAPDLAGWLHTYLAAKDLNLLYIDGASARKTRSGTMDSFDRILMNDTLSGGVEDEYKRAQTICDLAKGPWEDRIDGVIRLGGDFEIILCDFERNLDLESVVRVRENTPIQDHGPGSGGIGIRFVQANFNNFVSIFTYGLDLYSRAKENDSGLFHDEITAHLPRLNHLSTQDLEPIRQDVNHLILHQKPSGGKFDWQGITDMTVARYSNVLRELAFPTEEETHASLQGRIERLLSPFIDYSTRNHMLEVERCASIFLPRTAPTKALAYQAVHGVTEYICKALYDALADGEKELMTERMRHLVWYLDWAIWVDA